MRIITLFIFLSFINTCISQVPDLTNWKLDSLPNYTTREYNTLLPYVNWKFSKSGDKWDIIKNNFSYDLGDSLPSKLKYIETNKIADNGDRLYRFVKKIPGGYLVGLQTFGGLYFINDDGLGGYKIDDSFNIFQIFEYNGRYLALEGYPQRNYTPKGQILEIFKNNNVWKSKTVIKMEEAPELVADYKNEKIIITCESVLRFGKDLKPKVLLKAPFFWGIGAPYSTLINNNDLYIAMANAVLKIKSFDSKPVYEWYIPK